MKIKRITRQIQRKILYKEIKDGYVVYKDIYYETNNPKNILKEKQGVVKEEVIKSLKDFEEIQEDEFLPYFKYGYDSICLTPILITKDIKREFQKRNGVLSEIMDENILLYPYDIFSKNENIYEVVLYCSFNEQLFDTNKRVLPKFKRLTYLDGFDNGTFQLEELKRHLETYSEIVSVEIKDIPYYNRDEYHNLSLNIDIVFEEETYRKLYDYKENSFEFIKKICDYFTMNQFKK